MSSQDIAESQYVCASYMNDRNVVDFYQELAMVNTTGEDVYLARADGKIITIPTVTASALNPRLEIRYLYRTGRPNSKGMFYDKTPSSYTKMELPAASLSIPYSKLLDGAYFIPSLGMSCAIQRHLAVIQETNPLGQQYQEKYIQDLSEKFLSGGTTPFVVYGNTHNSEYKYLYLKVNDRLMSVVLDHRHDQPEFVKLMINRGGRYDSMEINDIVWDTKHAGVFTRVVEGQTWIFGVDRAMVQKAITDEVDDRLSHRSDTEVNSLIEQKTAALRKELKNKEDLLAQIQKENELLKKELTTTKSELDRANSASRASYEQQVLAAKLAAQQMEQENIRQKQRLQEEEARLNKERDYYKFKYEQEINKAKVEKEQMSTRATQASSWANIAKAAAAIVPLIVSVAIWFTSRGKADPKAVYASLNGVHLREIASKGVSVMSHLRNQMSAACSSVCGWIKSLWN